ncbi:RNA chaperone Hfq [Paenibacillus sp. SC116]|uniref:RNA chaperone Hfq n=1 Tax=Paenibacillus sp. SC116 TaxID=2968986 RepID=UPI00215AF08F|nr:RNA chaperone Hfq [Paenibacillus sp. SC116]MCR8842662.1 RNA chaperone Hfq [Paenibacillus sp. SC116]
MNEKNVNIQEYILNQCRKNKIPLTILLKNGVPIAGTLLCFDRFTILVQSDRKTSLLFKNMISTIIPLEAIELPIHEEP